MKHKKENIPSPEGIMRDILTNAVFNRVDENIRKNNMEQGKDEIDLMIDEYEKEYLKEFPSVWYARVVDNGMQYEEDFVKWLIKTKIKNR